MVCQYFFLKKFCLVSASVACPIKLITFPVVSLFQVHPVLMVIGLVLLNGEGKCLSLLADLVPCLKLITRNVVRGGVYSCELFIMNVNL